MWARSSGGKSGIKGKVAPDDLDRVLEGERVRITRGLSAGLDHQVPNGKVGQEKAIDLLQDQGASGASAAGRASSP